MDLNTIDLYSKLDNNFTTDRTRLVNRVSNTIDQTTVNEDSFSFFLGQAKQLVNETNYLSNKAEVEEINYALGYTDSTHDLQVAQEKANVALQYTVAVRDRFLESYNTIMNMTI